MKCPKGRTCTDCRAELPMKNIEEQEPMVEYHLKKELPNQELETWIG